MSGRFAAASSTAGAQATPPSILLGECSTSCQPAAGHIKPHTQFKDTFSTVLRHGCLGAHLDCLGHGHHGPAGGVLLSASAPTLCPLLSPALTLQCRTLPATPLALCAHESSSLSRLWSAQRRVARCTTLHPAGTQLQRQVTSIHPLP